MNKPLLTTRTETSIHDVDMLCAQRGVKFTPMRRLSLEIMLEHGTPLRAYDLIRQLQQRLSRRVDPPTAYRALEFLMAQNLILRVESANAYIPNPDPENLDPKALLLCSLCGIAQQIPLPELEDQMALRAAASGFRIERRIIEYQGICGACERQAASETST